MTQTYTKQTSDYYDELISSGFKKYTKEEFNSLRDTFCTRFVNERISKLEIDSMNSKFQTRKELGFENDITDSISYTNRGMILWTLKSVTKLGMFMTKTESAKLFLDSIIEELRILVLK